MAGSEPDDFHARHEELIRRSAAAWERARPVLEEERKRTIRSADTAESIRWFDTIFRQLGPDRRESSGLLEQQRLFAKVRKKQT
jgi:hypothetical protein